MSSASGGGTEGVLAAAGWYPDSSGLLRWWDGHGWDMAKRGSGQAPTWALLSHLSLFVMLLVAAIVLRVSVGRRDRFYPSSHDGGAQRSDLVCGDLERAVAST